MIKTNSRVESNRSKCQAEPDIGLLNQPTDALEVRFNGILKLVAVQHSTFSTILHLDDEWIPLQRVLMENCITLFGRPHATGRVSTMDILRQSEQNIGDEVSNYFIKGGNRECIPTTVELQNVGSAPVCIRHACISFNHTMLRLHQTGVRICEAPECFNCLRKVCKEKVRLHGEVVTWSFVNQRRGLQQNQEFRSKCPQSEQ